MNEWIMFILTITFPIQLYLGWYCLCKLYNKWLRSYVWKGLKYLADRDKNDY